MTEIVTMINGFGTQIIAVAVALGLIGLAMGTLLGVLGYRHGADISRGAVIGMIMILCVRVLAATIATTTGVTLPTG